MINSLFWPLLLKVKSSPKIYFHEERNVCEKTILKRLFCESNDTEIYLQILIKAFNPLHTNAHKYIFQKTKALFDFEKSFLNT